MHNLKNIYIYLFLFAAVYLSFYLNLGSVPLFDLDEGAFSEATREMLQNKNYITTYLGGELRFDKPILIYWFQALSVKIFGLNEFALRLPSALAATFWVVAVYIFVKHFFDKNIASFSAFMLASSLQVSVIAKAAIADALLNLFIALSMFLVFAYIKQRQKKQLYFAFFLMALGVLTKGPIAVLIPLAVTLIYLLIKKEFKFWLFMVFEPVGILIFLLVAAPWYIAEYIDQGNAFIEGFIFKHNVSRFSTSFEGHSGSLFYYIPVVLIGVMPFTSVLISAIKNARGWFEDKNLFFSIWFIFVFVFFSLSGTKLPHYVIYGYTPLFILMAQNISKIRSKFLLILPLFLLLIVLLFLPEIALFFKKNIKDVYAVALVDASKSAFGFGYRFVLLCVLGALAAFVIFKRLDLVKTLFLQGTASLIAINGAIIPAYGRLVQEPVKNAALYIRKNNIEVKMWKMNNPSAMVYAKKIIKKGAPKYAGDIVLTKVSSLKFLKKYDIMYQENGIVIVRIIEGDL